jgi:hypothetical protein
MTKIDDTARGPAADAAASLREAQTLHLATLNLVRDATSAMLPLSATAVPNADRFVTTMDSLLREGFAVAAKAVETQYKFAAEAIERLSPSAA